MTTKDLADRFSGLITAASIGELQTDCTLGGALTLFEHGRISCSYAPFEHINPNAKIVLVGITPGRRQATDALIALRKSLLEGKSMPSALSVAKATASFAGAMRSNLSRMFDYVGLNEHLGLASCSELFTTGASLVHYTSALRNPVFVDGANYSGQPKISATPVLANVVRDSFFKEARSLHGPLWVPLGGVAEVALQMAVSESLIPAEAVLSGFPHASGANAERISYFVGGKSREALSYKTNPDLIDARKELLLAALSKYRS
jgi:hypothetical protein